MFVFRSNDEMALNRRKIQFRRIYQELVERQRRHGVAIARDDIYLMSSRTQTPPTLSITD